MTIGWDGLTNVPSRSYVCGHCGNFIASNLGYLGKDKLGDLHFIRVCHSCGKPTYFFPKQGLQVPGAIFGASVPGITHKEVESLYNEARSCLKVDAPTAAILCCRKLLMNIAVSHGAPVGQKFVDYVDYLASKGFLPPGGRTWVDVIRTKGNEATHEIKIMSEKDARELISFCEMLLRFIYEFPARVAGPSTDDG